MDTAVITLCTRRMCVKLDHAIRCARLGHWESAYADLAFAEDLALVIEEHVGDIELWQEDVYLSAALVHHVREAFDKLSGR